MKLSLQPQIGAVAGWKLELAPITMPPADAPAGLKPVRGTTEDFSSLDYRGSVDATLVGGLASGSYTVVVEDVAEEDYARLAKLASEKPLEARLYMFWVDAPRPSVGDDGLVAVLRVTALRRRPGKWRYEMVVEGREWVFDRMMSYCPIVTGNGPLDTAMKVARALHVELDAPPLPPVTTERRSTTGTRAIEQMRLLEAAMVAAAAKAERPRAVLGMYLVRDGKLQLGPDRISPDVVRPMLGENGELISIVRNGSIGEDATAVGIDDDPGRARRDVFIATLRGRPDLKPGDVVDLRAPDSAAFGEELGFALGPAAQFAPNDLVTAYIQEVSHRLSREQGFLTVVRCIAAATDDHKRSLVDRLWLTGTDAYGGADAGSSESALATFFDRLRDAASTDKWPDVAEVRAVHLTSDDPQLPAQTVKLWRGLETPDGATYAAARQPFAKTRTELTSAPYLTPFAYGLCGLVLPRYPGTRVLIAHRGGNTDDPVDVGALWSRGGAPAVAQVGDWWLTVPFDVDGDDPPRAAAPDDEQLDEKLPCATNDLIDGAGNRVIEVGKLTIRIGKARLETHIGGSIRPSAADDPVTIDHEDGKARIVIAQDGSITIESKQKVTIKGEQGIALESGKDITMTVGGNVDVKKGT